MKELDGLEDLDEQFVKIKYKTITETEERSRTITISSGSDKRTLEENIKHRIRSLGKFHYWQNRDHNGKIV
jgi:hypothetical protein